MKRIFLPLTALFISLSAFAFDAATEGVSYDGNDWKIKVVGLANGKVAVTDVKLDAEVTTLTIPATFHAQWDHGTEAACDLNFEVEQVGTGSWAIWVERESTSFLASVTSLTISEGVTTIAANAFSSATSLQTLTLEGNIVVGDYAFYGCEALTNIVFNGTNMPACGADAFKGSTNWDTILNQCKVTVKTEDVKATFNHDPWDHWTAFYQKGNVIVDKATTIDATNANAKVVKRIVNGQMLVIREGKTYTMDGQRIQ